MIFITGAMRSGTTVFRELVCSAGYQNLDEIFHGKRNHQFRFFDYLYKKIRLNPDFLYPICYKAIFYEYVQNIEDLTKGLCVADVKYHNYRLLDSSFKLESSIPFFVEFLMTTKYPVIRIRRFNKLRMIVSKKLAEAADIWATNAKSFPVIAVDLQPNTVCDEIFHLQNQDEKIENLLSLVPNVYRIDYESMFLESGDFSPFAVSIAEHATNSKLLTTKPILIRQNPERLSSLIANYEEVEFALRGTSVEWMLYD